MAVLSPAPFSGLVARFLLELERSGSAFDLPRHRFVSGDAIHDTSVTIHGRRVSSPLGPSAGPHTQMAQNIALAWLAGARVFELKTIQSLEHIDIQRPCIDTGHATYNIEWSQELTLEQSLEEYVKASMLLAMLPASGAVVIAPSFGQHLFDMSVGYDLAGIRGDGVRRFLRGMADATHLIRRLRAEIPDRWRQLRDLAFDPHISRSVTLSTFHGCPVSEIEQIATFLMEEHELDCAIKLNPTLLGASELTRTLHDSLGYTDVHVPASAFEKDASWDEMAAIVGRLRDRARSLGRSFAVKLTNTLVVENRSNFLPPAEKLAYLSGAPLHVLAMHLVQRFRREFDDLPISFSAGVDRVNYADAVSLGLAPVTVCTDLLRQGSYGRLHAYDAELVRRMDAAGATTVEELILRTAGRNAGTLAEAKAHNTNRYVESVDRDPRYRREQGTSRARGTGHPLTHFDCATCDLCISACPNGANFRLPSLGADLAMATLVRTGDEWSRVDAGSLHLSRKHQLATFADFCNDCGNCEMFCPDDGAPNRLKLRFFGSEESWRSNPSLDGLLVAPGSVSARIDGTTYALAVTDGTTIFSGPRFRVEIGTFDPRRISVLVADEDAHSIDLYPYALMDYVRRATFDRTHVNSINCVYLEGDPPK